MKKVIFSNYLTDNRLMISQKFYLQIVRCYGELKKLIERLHLRYLIQEDLP